MTERPPDTKITRGGWFALGALAVFLAWAMWYAFHTWSALSGVPMDAMGWTMLILGVVVTLLVGGGLMGLLFYSSRKNYDR